MNISSETSLNIRDKLPDEKYSKSNKKNRLKNFNDITNNYLEKWKLYILNIREIIKTNKKEELNLYNERIENIIKKIEKLFINYIKEIKNSYDSQYENILRAYEQKIRNLYENRFNLELNKKILEESNKNLLRKEKDFEILKEKSGIIVQNGKIINNSRKENEIFILRKENSILKDIIEKQNQENLRRIKRDSKEKQKLNQRLIMKLNNLSLKNKKNRKNLYVSISPRHQAYKKTCRSHPRSNHRFKSDFISNLNNKLNASYKSLLISPSSKSCQNNLIKNIFHSSRKNRKISRFNNINIQVQNNNNKIRKLSPNNILKKKLIPKITEKNFKSLNKSKIYEQYLKRNFRKRYKSSNPSALGVSITNTQRENSKDYNSYSKINNNSECLNDKKISILNLSILKTLSSKANKKKKCIKHIKFLSPTYGNMINLIPKMKNLLNLRMHKNKFSNSFTMKNNSKNTKLINIKENQNNKIKNNFNIKRIVFSKKDNSKVKNQNIVNNKINKNIPDYKKYNKINKSKNIINSSSNHKGKISNSINNINTYNNNIKKMIENNF